MGAVTLENVLAYANTGTAWTVYHYGFSVPTLTLRHCTLADNAGGGVYALSDVSIQNSIIVRNGAKGLKTDDLTPLCDYNDVYGHSVSNYEGLVAGAHDRSADPGFAGSGDYHFYGSSPCRDTGTNLGVLVDLDGSARPLGSAYDMGCYEAKPPPPGSVFIIR